MARKRTRPERYAENKFVAWVRDGGGMCRKMNGLGYRDWPDQQVLKAYVRRPLWIEFKRVGEFPTPSQYHLHGELTRLGQVVHVCRSFEEAKLIYEKHCDL